ncbi:cytochrome c biogenesis protein CcdA, partial [Thermodesulfovibrio sp.]|uniref:cytochrome c biogenesis CcdA family protein n=1 Tax=Thermodesulfovibrio sp. TaxID=2067987 RepID=UPI002612E4F3
FLREFRLNIKVQKFGTPLGAFFIGLGFAAGWSPCIGPVLGSILIYSSMSGSVLDGMKMLGAYSLGMAIPFLFTSLIINSAMQYLRKSMKVFRLINYFIGASLIILGFMMICGLSIV